MSSQSILERNADRIQEAAEILILKNAHYRILEKRFSLKKHINRDEVKHANKLLSFICSENCNLMSFIDKILIEGESTNSTCFHTEN